MLEIWEVAQIEKESLVDILANLCYTLRLTKEYEDLQSLEFDTTSHILTAHFLKHKKKIKLSSNDGATIIKETIKNI